MNLIIITLQYLTANHGGKDPYTNMMTTICLQVWSQLVDKIGSNAVLSIMISRIRHTFLIKMYLMPFILVAPVDKQQIVTSSMIRMIRTSGTITVWQILCSILLPKIWCIFVFWPRPHISPHLSEWCDRAEACFNILACLCNALLGQQIIARELFQNVNQNLSQGFTIYVLLAGINNSHPFGICGIRSPDVTQKDKDLLTLRLTRRYQLLMKSRCAGVVIWGETMHQPLGLRFMKEETFPTS